MEKSKSEEGRLHLTVEIEEPKSWLKGMHPIDWYKLCVSEGLNKGLGIKDTERGWIRSGKDQKENSIGE